MSGSQRPAGSSGSTGSPRRQKRPYRQPDRSLSRAGTRGGGPGMNQIMLWSGIAVAVAVVVIGLAYLATRPNAGAAVNDPLVLTPTDVPASGTTLGNSGSRVTIDVYGDFRCSACFWFTVTGNVEGRLIDQYVRPGKAKLVWHDYTIIDSMDGSSASRDAANAAQCANDQGKFWAMHDWLYGNQIGETPDAFTKERLMVIGEKAGMDMASFRPCVEEGRHDAEVTAETKNAPSGITGTPSVFVNGRQVGTPGNVPTYNQISAAIEGSL